MYRGHTIGVVVPAYNEAAFVADVLAAIPPFVDRIYAIDDRSTDDTWVAITAYADALAGPTDPGADRATDASGGPSGGPVDGPTGTATAGDPSAGDRVVPIRHETNRGAGGAIKTGYRRALEDGLDVVVTIDADGQMDPRQMTKVIDPIVAGRADYAKGNRLTDRATREEMPAFRLVGNWLLTALTKVASGYWRTRDPQNGYTAISRRALEAIDVDAIYEYYGYSNDVLVRLNAAQQCVADVSMPAAYGDEQSSIRYETYVPKVSVLLLRRFVWRLRVRYLARQFHPLVLCYLLGALGIGYGLVSVLGAAATGDAPDVTAAGTAGPLPVLVLCGLFTAIAMAFDRQENRRLEVRLE